MRWLLVPCSINFDQRCLVPWSLWRSDEICLARTMPRIRLPPDTVSSTCDAANMRCLKCSHTQIPADLVSGSGHGSVAQVHRQDVRPTLLIWQRHHHSSRQPPWSCECRVQDLCSQSNLPHATAVSLGDEAFHAAVLLGDPILACTMTDAE